MRCRRAWRRTGLSRIQVSKRKKKPRNLVLEHHIVDAWCWASSRISMGSLRPILRKPVWLWTLCIWATCWVKRNLKGERAEIAISGFFLTMIRFSPGLALNDFFVSIVKAEASAWKMFWESQESQRRSLVVLPQQTTVMISFHFWWIGDWLEKLSLKRLKWHLKITFFIFLDLWVEYFKYNNNFFVKINVLSFCLITYWNNHVYVYT